ncbi:ATP-binding protein [Cellulomonas biazotea]|uniref:ATP-binding protein n=1 Tax=Cellulomonas biazotea TaxID=1709 RepID=UPI0010309FB9|nr:ATP-binding protein [Cellulomonas biazotea]
MSFTDEHDAWMPLSVIAGPTQTGKTSIADFIMYLLGDDEQPEHAEIVGAVRTALLEIELGGELTTIERAAAGRASSFASTWRAPIDEIAQADEIRVTTEPTSDPEGLSQFVLRGFGLDGVSLPLAPTQEQSDAHRLSIRDVFRVMFLPNRRLDNMDLAFEKSHYMLAQKFRQLIDVIFGVHDPEGAQLLADIKAASEAVNAARRAENALEAVALEDYPTGPLGLNAERESAEAVILRTTELIASLDANRRSNDGALAELRAELQSAQKDASRASVRVRDRQSLLDRLTALRAQYADDKKKLTFLQEAERLFDPLSVVTCPACMRRLETVLSVDDGKCGLCHAEIGAPGSIGDVTAVESSQALLEAELRAVSRRLTDLTEYWERLDRDRARLEEEQRRAAALAEELAVSIDHVAETPAPWLAERDALTGKLGQARLDLQFAKSGLRSWQRVTDAGERRARLEVTLQRLRNERNEGRKRPDRSAVIRRLSDRFREILSDFGYPKLSDAWIDDALIPYVRGMHYTRASSGGLVLISLAYHLAIWELAFESDAAAPGLLVIDSPQKNLGHSADRNDPEFADTQLVENFYRHVLRWLEGDGAGAQLVVIDNTPPEFVGQHVIVHYTRNPEIPPYGLITDATE